MRFHEGRALAAIIVLLCANVRCASQCRTLLTCYALRYRNTTMIASLPNQHCASAGKVCPGRLRIPWSIVRLDMQTYKGLPCKLTVQCYTGACSW